MKRINKAYQLFYYFRLGYSTYFMLLFGVINLMTSTYFLAVSKVPALLAVFPTFEIYVAAGVGIGVPIIVLAGWMHMKKIGMYSAEQNVAVQENPFNYKVLPGHNKEVVFPAYREMIRLMIKQGTGEPITDADRRRIKEIERGLDNLIEGGHAGTPPRGAY